MHIYFGKTLRRQIDHANKTKMHAHTEKTDRDAQKPKVLEKECKRVKGKS